MKSFLFICILLLSSVALSANEGHLNEGMVNPGFYEKPEWFKDSFLELRDELENANENNRQLMLYFHQDGCPYCKKLLDDNFSRKDIIEKMRQNFDLLEINMWGDKTVTLLTGEELSEKEFARQMKIMFTPTLVILDKKGQSQFRMNGYYAPDKFSAALDSILSKKVISKKIPSKKGFFESEKQQSNINMPSAAPVKKPTEKFIYKGNDLASLINTSKKPVMILFEQGECAECDELHGDIFRRLPVYKQLQQFSIAQVDINSKENIIGPEGQNVSQKELAKVLKIQYTPSILFYEPGKNIVMGSENKAVFRSEAYLKSFHIQALLDYIISKAYLSEPEFQRFVQRRAEKMREEGSEVDLWE